MPLPAANPTQKQVTDRFRDWNKPTDFLVIGNQPSLDGPTIAGNSPVHQRGRPRTTSGDLGCFKTQADYRGNYVFNEALKDDTLGATAAHRGGSRVPRL